MTWAVPETQIAPLGFRTRCAAAEPGAVEFVIGIEAAGFVPIAFMDGDHFPGVAGDAAVGKEIRRVGEDEVDGIFGDLFQDFEAIALVDAEMMFGVVEGGGGKRSGDGFGHKRLIDRDS